MGVNCCAFSKRFDALLHGLGGCHSRDAAQQALERLSAFCSTTL
jgi:hypothetical protein